MEKFNEIEYRRYVAEVQKIEKQKGCKFDAGAYYHEKQALIRQADKHELLVYGLMLKVDKLFPSDITKAQFSMIVKVFEEVQEKIKEGSR